MKSKLYPDQEKDKLLDRKSSEVPILAESPVRKIRYRSGQAIIVDLVVVGDTEFAYRRDRVQWHNSVLNRWENYYNNNNKPFQIIESTSHSSQPLSHASFKLFVFCFFFINLLFIVYSLWAIWQERCEYGYCLAYLVMTKERKTEREKTCHC